MSEIVKVVSIFSASYTGTTWLNYVLASHPAAMYLGPYDRARQNLQQFGASACRIHGEGCPFWNGFLRGFDPERNFFLQLAAYSGKTHFLINNPQMNGGEYARDLKHPDIQFLPILIIRDLRAIFASKLRKSKKESAAQVLNDFVLWCAGRPLEVMQEFDPLPVVRYEEVRHDLVKVLENIGPGLGLEYSAEAERFWTYDHHPVAGNHGPCSFIAFHQGRPYPDFVGREHYEKQFEQINSGAAIHFNDERWRQELGPSLLRMFDIKYGEINAKMGYPRDSFGDAGESLLNKEMFGWNYANWLDALIAAGANFITARDVLNGDIDKERCNILLRHDLDDCDYHENVWPMLQLEAQRGLRSTSYVFAQEAGSDWVRGYWSPSRPFEPSELIHFQEQGFEFGLHVDVVGRCFCESNEVDPEQAMRLIDRDLVALREQGLEVCSLAGHGFKWANGVRPMYDNFTAEADYSETRGESVPQSLLYHVTTHFLRQGGRRITDALPPEKVAMLSSAKLHDHGVRNLPSASSDLSHLDGEAIVLSDGMSIWRSLTIDGFCRLVPRLAGCLVIILTHPFNFKQSDGQMIFKTQSAELTDQDVLKDCMTPAFNFQPVDPPLKSLSVQSLDLADQHNYREGWSETANPSGQHRLLSLLQDLYFLKKGEELSRRQAVRFLESSPLVRLVLVWFNKQYKNDRANRIQIGEVARDLAACSLFLANMGVNSDCITMRTRNPDFIDIQPMLHLGDFGQLDHLRIKRFEDGRSCFTAPLDLFLAVDWDNGQGDHQALLSEARRILRPNGFLAFTFVDKYRAEAGGWLHSPVDVLRAKARNSISPPLAERWLERYGFRPLFMQSDHPASGFPESLIIAERVAQG